MCSMELANGGSSSNAQFGVEKLVGTNYNYWRMCMDTYLQGQDLWDLIVCASDIPANTPENAEPRRKWKIKCGKPLFALRTSIGKEFIDHVRDVSSQKKSGRHLRDCFLKRIQLGYSCWKMNWQC